MEKKYKLLFVCLGNICRSPSAEGIMRQLVEDKGCANSFEIDSAGTYGGHAGALPDERMRHHASKRGYVLDSRSRQFYPSADFEHFDLIVCMDNQNVHNILRLAETEDERSKVVKMTDFCRHHHNFTEVPDPYYGGAAGFELVLDLLEDAAEGLYEHVTKK